MDPTVMYILSFHSCSLNSIIRSLLSCFLFADQFRISFHWPCNTIGTCMVCPCDTSSLYTNFLLHLVLTLFFPFKLSSKTIFFSYAGKSTEEVSFRTVAGCLYNSTAHPVGTFNLGCESACTCKAGSRGRHFKYSYFLKLNLTKMFLIIIKLMKN